ncbi:CBS domain-containing protein [Saccharothrix sp. 6-C]|nr:CBS domain-containing protein [Saccharothrix sp. 6-C]
MTRDVVTVTPETPVRDACDRLARRGLTMLPW